MKICQQVIFSNIFSFIFYCTTSLIANFLSIAVAFYVITLLSKYLSSAVTETLVTLSVGVTIFIILEIFVRRIRYNYMAGYVQAYSDHLYRGLFNSFLKARWENLDKILINNEFSIQKYLESFNKTYNPNNIIALIDAFFGIFIFVLIYLLSPELAISVGIIALCTLIIPQLIGGMSKQTQKNFLLISKTINQKFTFFEKFSHEFRHFSNKQLILKNFRDQYSNLNNITLKKNKTIDGVVLISHSLTSFNTALIFGIGAFLATRGILDVSTLIGISILSARILFGVQRINTLFHHLRENRSIFKWMEQITNLPKESAGTLTPPLDGFIEAQNISFIFHKSPAPLFQNLNFKIGPGDVFIITGGNGSGKTTLCQVLLGLRNPTTGNILISNYNLRNLNLDWYRNNICYLGQRSDLFPGTITENIILEDDSDPNPINFHDLIKSFDLQDFLTSDTDDKIPQTILPHEKLSEGVKKRISLSRALLAHGQFIILDDPTEGIDQKGKFNLYSILNKLKTSGKTLIIASEDPYILKAANLVFDLTQNRLIRAENTTNYERYKQQIQYRMNLASKIWEDLDRTIIDLKERTKVIGRPNLVGIAFLFLLLIPTLAWSMLGVLDVSINLRGEVKPSSQIKNVQHFEGGFIKTIHVKEGQNVKKGQLLITLDPVQRGADVDELKSRLLSLNLMKIRLLAETKLQTPKFPRDFIQRKRALVNQELNIFESRQAIIDTQKRATAKKISQKKELINEITSRTKNANESLKLIDEQIKISAGLLEKKITSRFEHIKLLRERSSLKSRIEEDKFAIKGATASYEESRINYRMLTKSFIERAQKSLKEKSKEHSELSERLKKLEDSLKRTKLFSPVQGIIKKLHYFTLGEVVAPGATVIEVVPNQDILIIETKLPPKEASYVHQDNPVLARLTNVDAFQYPPINGKVIHLSADTISRKDGSVYYLMRVKLNDNKFLKDDSRINLFSGMVLNLSLITGQRTVFEYIFDPLIKNKHLALRER